MDSLFIIFATSIGLSALLTALVIGRVVVHYVWSEEMEVMPFLRSRWFMLFGVFERRVIGLSIVLGLCSILNTVVSSRKSQSECETMSSGASVFPILLWLEAVALPMVHLMFIIPSIWDSIRDVAATRYNQSMLETREENHVPLQILKFVSKVVVLAAAIVVFWLPVYLLYTNDSRVYGICLRDSGALFWYMGTKTAIAASAVSIALLVLLVIGIAGLIIYAAVKRLHARMLSFRLVAFMYAVVGLICTAITLPELLYRSFNDSIDASHKIPEAMKYLSIVSLPLHAFLLCCITLFAFLFVRPQDLEYGMKLDYSGNEFEDKHPCDHISLTFKASPRYEDKYLSRAIMQDQLSQQNGIDTFPLSAISSVSSLNKLPLTSVDSNYSNRYLPVPESRAPKQTPLFDDRYKDIMPYSNPYQIVAASPPLPMSEPRQNHNRSNFF
ncbi:hypothetical protein V1512DRAFT_264987 [Lipomyces arxii]|uniref:uncharacterized protein n=1 Tax=Lipomyces arxii TaxID=56418 RepID=UPI0034CDE97C